MESIRAILARLKGFLGGGRLTCSSLPQPVSEISTINSASLLNIRNLRLCPKSTGSAAGCAARLASPFSERADGALPLVWPLAHKYWAKPEPGA